MTTETVETPASAPADPEPTPQETKTAPPEGGAAPQEEADAVPQVEVEEKKPEYLTREEWERERAEVATRAATDALEQERRRRQTENARKAQQEQRDREEAQEAADTIRAALVSQGFDPSVATDESVLRAVDRLARKKADRLAGAALQTVDPAWEYLTAPVFGKQVDFDESFEAAARSLGPKLQQLVEALRPAFEKAAREGYIAESELPKRVDDEIARRNAKAREGKEELKRVEGSPSETMDRSLMAVTNRIIGNTADDEDHRLWKSRFGTGR